MTAELNSSDRLLGPQCLKYLLPGPLEQKFADPYSGAALSNPVATNQPHVAAEHLTSGLSKLRYAESVNTHRILKTL